MNVRSRIYISADLQTSPNSLALVNIVIYYLDKNLKVQSILIGMRRVYGAYSGENITKAIIPILQDFNIAPRLGYYISDSYGANDTYLREIYRRLRLDINSRRIRYLEYILNLAAEAFLFSTNLKLF